MDNLWIDLRGAVRTLRRDRLFALASIATLALTLGASTAVFSIVNGVILRPLAYREAQQLVSIREIQPALVRQYPTLPANLRHFEAWRDRATSFASIAAIDWRTTTLTGAGEPAQLSMLRASGTLFEVLQLNVALGRPLTRDDEGPDRPAVAVIAQRLWTDRLGRDPHVVGRSVTLGGTPFTVVGVLERGASLPRFDVLGDAATLSSALDVVVPFRLNVASIGWMGQFNYPVLGRLKPGVGLEAARAELNVIQDAIAETAARETHQSEALRAQILGLDDAIVGRARLGLLLLLGAIAGVVLIACANLANLSLTRALGRLRDAAVRSALGASRGRLVRAIVVEQVVLAAVGGALGLFVARRALDLFVKTAPIDLPRVGEVAIDGRVLAFAASVAILAGLAVALLPAWRVGRDDVQAALRAGGHGATDRGGLQVRAVLLGLQVALSVTLLIVTGLFIVSFVRLVGVDPGFSADRVLAVEIAPAARRYPDEQARAALYDRILESSRSLPGIASAAWTSALPLTGETFVDGLARIGDTRPFDRRPNANYRFVGPEYFRTLSMPILKGRSLEERDRGRATTAAVISARAAESLWPGEDPIGRQFSRGNPANRFEVVGVVVDGHPTALETEAPLMVYVPYWYDNEGKSVLLVQASGDPASVVSELRRVIRGIDPEVAVADTSPLQRTVDRAVAGRRYQMWLFTAFAIVALVIATVGVYATTAYGVSRRRREMNIRVALGARASQVFALVLRQSATPLVAGLAVGCVGALAVGTIVAGLLFKVRATDPRVLLSAVVLVGGVGLLASATAARQGLRIDPAAALRDE